MTKQGVVDREEALTLVKRRSNFEGGGKRREETSPMLKDKGCVKGANNDLEKFFSQHVGYFGLRKAKRIFCCICITFFEEETTLFIFKTLGRLDDFFL